MPGVLEETGTSDAYIIKVLFKITSKVAYCWPKFSETVTRWTKAPRLAQLYLRTYIKPRRNMYQHL